MYESVPSNRLVTFFSGFSDSAVLVTFNALSTVTTIAGIIVEVTDNDGDRHAFCQIFHQGDFSTTKK